MARGTIYYITDRPDEPVIGFDSISLMKELDAIGADCADDKSSAESVSAVSGLRDDMLHRGARIICNPKTPCFAFALSLDNDDEFKRDYFGPRLAKLKEKAAALQLYDVIQSAPALDDMLNEEYGDRVYFNGRLLTYDDFIRQMEQETAYYVLDRVLYLH